MDNNQNQDMSDSNPRSLRELVLSSEPSGAVANQQCTSAGPGVIGDRPATTARPSDAADQQSTSAGCGGTGNRPSTTARPSGVAANQEYMAPRASIVVNQPILRSETSTRATSSTGTGAGDSTDVLQAQYAADPANGANTIPERNTPRPTNARARAAIISVNVTMARGASRDRERFFRALHRMAANNWANNWGGNYSAPGPSNLREAIQRASGPGRQALARGFAPTTMATFGPGVQRAPTLEEQKMAVATNMSKNYRGDPGNKRNYSDNELADDQNTSFHIDHLPANVTEKEILGVIFDCGRIYSIHISIERVHDLGDAACKLVFMTVRGARRFRFFYQLHQLLYVRGQRARIVDNRNRVPEQVGLPPPISRCLEATGPAEIINMAYLTAYFDPLFRYQIDSVIMRSHPTSAIACLEIRFGSYRAQAAMAHIILTRHEPFRSAGVTVRYARDPCDEINAPGAQRAIGH